MYIKTIKTKGKKYKHYYHNVKTNNNVKNIFLESSKRKVLDKLKNYYRKPHIQLKMYIYTIRGDNYFTKE